MFRFKAEASSSRSSSQKVDLGTWDRRYDARVACEAHAEQTLAFQEAWRGLWQASSETSVYHIILVSS